MGSKFTIVRFLKSIIMEIAILISFATFLAAAYSKEFNATQPAQLMGKMMNTDGAEKAIVSLIDTETFLCGAVLVTFQHALSISTCLYRFSDPEMIKFLHVLLGQPYSPSTIKTLADHLYPALPILYNKKATAPDGIAIVPFKGDITEIRSKAMKIPLLSDGITSISQFGGGEGISIGWSKVEWDQNYVATKLKTRITEIGNQKIFGVIKYTDIRPDMLYHGGFLTNNEGLAGIVYSFEHLEPSSKQMVMKYISIKRKDPFIDDVIDCQLKKELLVIDYGIKNQV